jgi:hypothetical protein
MRAANSQAALGWTLAECIQHFGSQTQRGQATTAGRMSYWFASKGYSIDVLILNGRVSRVTYISPSGFDLGGARILLVSNAPGALWTDPEKDEADNTYRFRGMVNGEYAYSAAVSADGRALVIWTKADNEALEASQEDDAKGL